jgi:hypothetical protein
MAFQFLCPQGHLLQGEPSQSGQQCSCPYCGTLFLIPQPVAAASPGAGVEAPPSPQNGPAGPPPDPGPEGFPGIRTEEPPARLGDRAAAARSSMPTDGAPEIVHISCPSGHELETPREMLGHLAMCPFCQAQFHLRWKNSVEYRRRKQEELERKQARAAKLWLQWSIAAAVVVVLSLILALVLF